MTMDDAARVPTPELDKRQKVLDSGAAMVLTEFYDWLHQTKGYVLARYVPEEEQYPGDGIYGEQPVPVLVNPEALFADFFGLDLAKIDAEQQALLEAIRKPEATPEPVTHDDFEPGDRVSWEVDEEPWVQTGVIYSLGTTEVTSRDYGTDVAVIEVGPNLPRVTISVAYLTKVVAP